MQLFPEDLDRLAPHIEPAIVRVPAFELGVKKVYNGEVRPIRLMVRRL